MSSPPPLSPHIAEADPNSPYEAPRPPSPEENEAPAFPDLKRTKVIRLTAEMGVLILAGMVGVLIRLGLEAVGEFDGRVVFPLIWPQAVGCAIMGTALARKTELIELYPPLYLFFTTGLAGSVTTFSSWMLEGYEAFANLGNYNRSGFHDLVDGSTYAFVTLGVSISALMFGEYCSRHLLPWDWLSPVNPAPPRKAPPQLTPADGAPSPLSDIFTITLSLVLYLAALLIYFLGPSHWHHDITFPLLLAPPGVLVRFFLSKLNTRQTFLDKFPIGTFLANIIGTAILSSAYVASRSPGKGGRTQNLSVTGCNALYALEQGFCGCLSTVSTFVVELRTVRGRRWKWFYGGGSLVCGYLVVLGIVGGGGVVGGGVGAGLLRWLGGGSGISCI